MARTTCSISIMMGLIAACGSLASCSDGLELSAADQLESGDGLDLLVAPVQGKEYQGRDLLGDRLDPLGAEPGYHLSTTTAAVDPGGAPLTVTFSGSASLIAGGHRGNDPFFNGVVLDTADGGQLRLRAVRGGYDLAFYTIGVRQTAADPWIDPCHGGDAVPLAGKWTRAGLHERDTGRISFACAGSVAYKCTVWGFLAGGDDTSLAWRGHQACTRMARADYCADGTSHTRDGTLIRITDFVHVTTQPPLKFDGVPSWPPPADMLFFEAAWNDGTKPASCLSRLRWQALPPGPLCNGTALPDPRLDTTAKFCEDLEWPDPGTLPTGALVFNESAYTDLVLDIWQNGPDWVSTVRGFYPEIQPFPGYVHFEQDALIERTTFAGDPSEFEPIRMFTNGSDHVVAGVSRPPPGFSSTTDPHDAEGYVRKSLPPPGLVLCPFKMYRSTVTGDYLSRVGPPPASYVEQWVIGYTKPPEGRTVCP